MDTINSELLQLSKDYVSSMSVREIAAKYKVSRSIIYSRVAKLKKFGYIPDSFNKGIISKGIFLKNDELISDILQGMSLQEMVDKYNRSSEFLYKKYNKSKNCGKVPFDHAMTHGFWCNSAPRQNGNESSLGAKA